MSRGCPDDSFPVHVQTHQWTFYPWKFLPAASVTSNSTLQANLLFSPWVIQNLSTEFSLFVFSARFTVFEVEPHYDVHHLAHLFSPSHAVWTWEVYLCQSIGCYHGKSWEYQPLQFTLELTFLHGQEEKHQVASLWRLLPSKHCLVPDSYTMSRILPLTVSVSQVLSWIFTRDIIKYQCLLKMCSLFIWNV